MLNVSKWTKYFITEIQSQERAGCENTAGEQRAMVGIFTSEKDERHKI